MGDLFRKFWLCVSCEFGGTQHSQQNGSIHVKGPEELNITVCRFVILFYIVISPKETILSAHSNEQILESARPIFEFFEREVKIGLGRKKTSK